MVKYYPGKRFFAYGYRMDLTMALRESPSYDVSRGSFPRFRHRSNALLLKDTTGVRVVTGANPLSDAFRRTEPIQSLYLARSIL